MTYSCGVWEDPSVGLNAAQEAKYELICRKLGLGPGMRLLDVGCGWGGMAIHAARTYGVRAVGVTLSREQAELARRRVTDAGLADRVEIRLADYREVDDGPYEAISSIGMFEHVGEHQLGEYFSRMHALLAPGGRLLNHGISRAAGQGPMSRNGFIQRYVFPDGELEEIGRVVSAIQYTGLEIRHVENLREHYALTLRAWVGNLEESYAEAVRLAGAGRARVWRLCLAGSALGFESGEIEIHQTLAVRAVAGSSGMPLRPEWEHPHHLRREGA
jgi:cyclopropane-fatty-acyl-phospholipid synthase